MKKHIFLFTILTMILSSCEKEEPIPTYILSTSVSPTEGGKITVSPKSPNYKEGDVVTLSAEPNEYWGLESWGGDLSGSESPKKITIEKNINAIAIFVKLYRDDMVFGPNGPTKVVDVTNSVTGKTWMDRNLGATQAATSSMDAASYGDLYQWGRGADGHQLRNSVSFNMTSNSDQPGHGDFIQNVPQWQFEQPIANWRKPQNINLWQGVNGINNPCPRGYRLPTRAEFEEEIASWSSKDHAGGFASPLKLPLAGGRGIFSLIGLYGGGSSGLYWTSTVDNQKSFVLGITQSGAAVYSIARATGACIRCIKN